MRFIVALIVLSMPAAAGAVIFTEAGSWEPVCVFLEDYKDDITNSVVQDLVLAKQQCIDEKNATGEVRWWVRHDPEKGIYYTPMVARNPS